jgi:hypothetical protein
MTVGPPAAPPPYATGAPAAPAPGAPAGNAFDDLEQLRLLSIFHYVVAGLAALVSLFPAIYLVLGLLMATGHVSPEDEGSRIFGWLMSSCASFFTVVGLVFAVLIALAGRSLAEQARYTYCLLIAAGLCVFVPFGTMLGVFTIIVLVRPSVQARFGVSAARSS